ncbi:MAG: phosphonate transport system permease protein [Methanolobus sp.]|nr:phosphonate transport system permease protein [Methanolobus sp.]
MPEDGYVSGGFSKSPKKINYDPNDGYKRVEKIKRSVVYKYIIPGIIGILFIWSIISTEFSLKALVEGYPYIVDFLNAMFPPAADKFVPMIEPAIETMQIAFLGTFFSVLLSIPVAVLAANNMTSSTALKSFAKSIIAFTRTVPDLVFALIFVSAVGLGPVPGILALSIHSVGMLGKLYAEAIEEVDIGPIEAVDALGGSKLQAIQYAVIPQVIPAFVAATLYRLDINVRSSIVLGLVGAGGIGFELMMAMRLFRYDELLSILVIIFAIVLSAEAVSNAIRKNIIGEETLK